VIAVFLKVNIFKKLLEFGRRYYQGELSVTCMALATAKKSLAASKVVTR
jgi:hypothetical protein